MTPKQEQFCREYLIDLNATQAAIRAGYSKKTAYSLGQRLLKNVEVQELTQKLISERGQRTDRTADEVIRRLWAIVEADGRKAFNADGSPRKPHELPDDVAAALSAIEMGDTVKVKLDNRLKALELLARHHGQLTDKVEHTGNVGQVQIFLPDNGRDQNARAD